jgi:hypothetical protein
MRDLRLPSLLIAVFILPVALASGQAVSLYGTFAPVQPSGVSVSAPNATFQTASYWAPGFGGGVTLGLIPIGPLRFGGDLRGSTRPGTNGADMVLAGVKLGVRIPFIKFRPYIQGSGGYLGTRVHPSVFPGIGAAIYSTSSTLTGRYAAYEILGGVDYPFLPFIDVRLFEIGGGKGYLLPGTSTANSAGTVSVTTINSGVVFHF